MGVVRYVAPDTDAGRDVREALRAAARDAEQRFAGAG
jgi:hypothetical protein